MINHSICIIVSRTVSITTAKPSAFSSAASLSFLLIAMTLAVITYYQLRIATIVYYYLLLLRIITTINYYALTMIN